jgi:glycine/D-amino acid oxidase-like deaminating enzyme
VTSLTPSKLDRRGLLKASAGLGVAGISALALDGCVSVAGQSLSLTGNPPTLPPVRAETDRLFDITVCIRPFRAAGPRIEAEQMGDTLIVHNYGHGGSGWSLSWGSGTLAVAMAMAKSPSEVAVLGCGALGLTAAILAQRAGAKVTIYARDLLPQTRSSRATGSWTPDSRIALANVATPGFGDLWEGMARTSFKTYRQYLGLPGTPVEWRDHYFISGGAAERAKLRERAPGSLDFAEYGRRIADLVPRNEVLKPEASPFTAPYVEKSSALQFNIADYGHTLLTDFLLAGGRIERREFHAPSELGALKEKVVINCPGYAARDLWKDESVVPVRGQIGWLIPQAELTYGAAYKGVNMLSRRDGIVIQSFEGGDMRGYGDDHEVPDRAESEHAVGVIAELYKTYGRA